MKLKIAIMDEYALALQGLYDNLKIIPEFEIVGAYTEAEELLQFLKDNAVDIVIADLMLKGSEEIELIENIKNGLNPNVRIIALVSENYEEIVYEKALELGVKAFLQKDTSYHELISCIVSVGKGNTMLPDFVVKENRSKVLSEIETEILKLLVKEYTNDKIAGELYISKRTVETHVKNICKKLGVEGRIGAVREAVRLKLV
jgi:two-component system vancomycin resistance associated response regulator VraR